MYAKSAGTGADLPAAFADHARERLSNEREIRDPRLRNPKGGEPARMRLIFRDLFGTQPTKTLKAVEVTAPLQIGQDGQLALGRRDDQLPTALIRDVLLFEEAIERLASFDARSRLQGAGTIVEPRMDDAAIASTLMKGEAGFGLQDDQRAPSRQEGLRCSEPDQATADDGHIVKARVHRPYFLRRWRRAPSKSGYWKTKPEASNRIGSTR